MLTCGSSGQVDGHQRGLDGRHVYLVVGLTVAAVIQDRICLQFDDRRHRLLPAILLTLGLPLATRCGLGGRLVYAAAPGLHP
jgi:hypothetical protein